LGQSMTEGILIVFLVAVGTIGLVGLFGDNIRALFGGSAAAIAGNPTVSNTGQEAQRTKWNLRGGSLSAYNPGGTSDRPAPAPPPGGGGFNPGGSGDSPNNSVNF
jgi:Flp pilus assembly pilin Flp